MREKGCEIGLVGLGVMGRSFALNMAEKGFKVAVYSRSEEEVRRFMKQAGNRPIEAGYPVEGFTGILKQPRTVLIFVPAGNAVDEVINELTLNFDSGDLLVDCGNSHYPDTARRMEMLAKKGLLFLGMGVSGGESGARHGPSLMPGGSEEGYTRIRPILEACAAQVKGKPCVAYLGPGSAGHYVKMVHNGIEYGIMQLIAESYDLLRRGLHFDVDHLRSIYERWSEGKLAGYLMEITARILGRKDERSGRPLIDLIVDRARQKGTGKWTSREALDLQTPVPTIDIAVAMRNLSDFKEERLEAAEALGGHSRLLEGDREGIVKEAERGLFAAILITYAQGMSLLRRASLHYGYGLDLEEIAGVWRGGCIIRSALLEEIRIAFRSQPDLENLMLSPGLGMAVINAREDLRKVICTGADFGIPVPGLMSALAYLDAYRSARLPADLIMAQRDCFGAHGYERIDQEGTFHTDWGC
jgi:6-phosphogluconate dehydrogenase